MGKTYLRDCRSTTVCLGIYIMFTAYWHHFYWNMVHQEWLRYLPKIAPHLHALVGLQRDKNSNAREIKYAEHYFQS